MTTETRNTRANEYGYEAGIEGGEQINPYGEGCAQHDAWQAGYEQGRQVRAEWEESNHQSAKLYA